MAKKVELPQQKHATWWIVLSILGGLFILSMLLVSCMSLFIGSDNLQTGNVLVIPVHGTITSTSSGGLFSSDVASADEIIKAINLAETDNTIKGVIFDINSPGGSAVASEEIADAIDHMKKPNVAHIREMGASGAFWIAVSTDHIVASRMSITGSVGVISSYLDFSELLQRYNVTYERLVAGKYKDMGSPFKDLKQDERAILQNKLDIIHGYFLDDVQKKRNLSNATRQEISTGMFFLGSEAFDLGLVDELGTEAQAKHYLEKTLNTTVETKVYVSKKSLFDMFSLKSDRFAYAMGQGIASSLTIQEGYPKT
jgi:protease IV